MNSLRSAWTPVLAGRPEAHRQAKGDAEARLHTRSKGRVILSIKLVQKPGLATIRRLRIVSIISPAPQIADPTIKGLAALVREGCQAFIFVDAAPPTIPQNAFADIRRSPEEATH